MNAVRLCTIVIGIFLGISGCAGHRLQAASGQISKDVAQFQGALSQAQDSLRREQQDPQVSINDTADRRDGAAAIVSQQQVEWAVDSAATGNELFAALQAQGRDAVATLLLPASAPTQAAKISFPIDKLGSISKALDRLAGDRDARTELQSLVEYGIAVNKQLLKLQNQDSSTVGSVTPPVTPGK